MSESMDQVAPHDSMMMDVLMVILWLLLSL